MDSQSSSQMNKLAQDSEEPLETSKLLVSFDEGSGQTDAEDVPLQVFRSPVGDPQTSHPEVQPKCGAAESDLGVVNFMPGSQKDEICFAASSLNSLDDFDEDSLNSSQNDAQTRRLLLRSSKGQCPESLKTNTKDDSSITPQKNLSECSQDVDTEETLFFKDGADHLARHVLGDDFLQEVIVSTDFQDGIKRTSVRLSRILPQSDSDDSDEADYAEYAILSRDHFTPPAMEKCEGVLNKEQLTPPAIEKCSRVLASEQFTAPPRVMFQSVLGRDQLSPSLFRDDEVPMPFPTDQANNFSRDIPDNRKCNLKNDSAYQEIYPLYENHTYATDKGGENTSRQRYAEESALFEQPSDNYESIVNKFLMACERGDYRLLQEVYIPNLKQLAGVFDVTKMTNESNYYATGLHLAILYKHSTAADLLIENFGAELVLQPYTHEENAGVTSLHLAIVNGMVDEVKLMLTAIKPLESTEPERVRHFLHAECTGSFFNHRWNISNVPVTLALLSEETEILGELLKHGADLLHRSSSVNGNTVIHFLALHSLHHPQDVQLHLGNLTAAVYRCGPETVRKFFELFTLTNGQGFTPLMFSLNIGASTMTDTLLHTQGVYQFPQWSYKPLNMNFYDVTELVEAQKPYNISGLEMLAYNNNKQLDLYNRQPFKFLVHKIWKRNLWLYICRLVFHAIMMTLFTVACLSKQIRKEHIRPAAAEEIWIVVVCCILTAVSSCLLFFAVADFLRYMFSWLPNRKLKLPFKLWFRISTFKYLCFLVDVLILIWTLLRLAGHRYEAVVAVIPLCVGWYSFIFYTFFKEKICIFMIMLNAMFFGNVMYFLVALTLILLGFGTGFASLMDPTKIVPNDMVPFTKLLNTLVRQTLALNDIDEYMDDFQFPLVARLLMLVFFIVSTVLLLNMLIAAMGDTYATVHNQKMALWYRVKLQMALHMERRSFKILVKARCCSQCTQNCQCGPQCSCSVEAGQKHPICCQGGSSCCSKICNRTEHPQRRCGIFQRMCKLVCSDPWKNFSIKRKLDPNTNIYRKRYYLEVHEFTD